MEHLSRLFRILLVAAFVLAVLEFSWQIVVTVIGVGLAGYIGAEIIAQYQRTQAYFNAVEQYAWRVGRTFNASEQVQAQLKFGLIVAGLIGLFLAGAGFTIYWSTPIYACFAFALIFGVMAVLGLRQSGDSAEVRRTFAARNNWANGEQGRLVGTVRGCPARIEIVKKRTRPISSSPSGMRSSSTTTFTHVTLTVNNPADLSFSGKESTIKKSRPEALKQRLLANVDLQSQLAAIYPAEFTLSGPELFLERRGEAHNAVELEFLLEFMGAVAAIVEEEAAFG